MFFVLQRRPWYINGGLLNIREMPKDREWTSETFRLAIFRVRVHELPLPYLNKKKKTQAIIHQGFLRMCVDILLDYPFQSGFFLNLPNGKQRCIQFKYENPPKIFFKCGIFNQEAKECQATVSMVCPPAGKTVPMYGPWIKARLENATCFSLAAVVATHATSWLFQNLSVNGSNTGEPSGSRSK